MSDSRIDVGLRRWQAYLDGPLANPVSRDA